jgi:hypothetical protein
VLRSSQVAVAAVALTISLGACSSSHVRSGKGASPETYSTRSATSLVVIPPPEGFTGPAQNLPVMDPSYSGPVTPAIFSQRFGSPSASTEFGVVDGYRATYLNATIGDRIDIDLTVLRSASAARLLTGAAGPATGSVASPIAGIPGAVALDDSTADSHGLFHHSVTAAKGVRVMIIEYTTRSAGPVPLILVLARQQFLLL